MAKQFGLTKNEFYIPKDTRIIRAEEYRDLVDGQKIIDAAKARAKEILVKAQEERSQCHELGYQDGLKEARALVLKELVDVYARAGDYLKSAEETLMQIVMASLKRITGESLDQGVIQNQLQKAIKEELVRGRLKVRLHPEVAERVGQELYQLANRHPVIDYLEVVKDSNVDRGSCLIESDLGVVDMSIDRQLTALFEVIKQYIPDAIEVGKTAEQVIASLLVPSSEEVVNRFREEGVIGAVGGKAKLAPMKKPVPPSVGESGGEVVSAPASRKAEAPNVSPNMPKDV